MMVSMWVSRLADEFWQLAGDDRTFPRKLQPAIIRAFPLGVIALSGLRTDHVRRLLTRSHFPCPNVGPDRDLRGCLVAHNDTGFVFLDADDPEAEQRFSLAHELAHFLRHYRQPRQEARRLLGEEALEALDGLRPPPTDERLTALWRHVPLRVHYHMMERNEGQRIVEPQTVKAEQEADELAWELLAPVQEVHAQCEYTGNADEPRNAVRKALQLTFGLPAPQALAYTNHLLPEPPRDPLIERLRK